MAGRSQPKKPKRKRPIRRQKKGTAEATAAKKNRTNRIAGDDFRNSIQTRKPNQIQIGINQQMFSSAVTLPIQSLRKYARKSTTAAIGLTRSGPNYSVIKYGKIRPNPLALVAVAGKNGFHERDFIANANEKQTQTARSSARRDSTETFQHLHGANLRRLDQALHLFSRETTSTRNGRSRNHRVPDASRSGLVEWPRQHRTST